MSAGLTAFREAYMSAGSTAAAEREFGSFEARRLRYAVLWAMVENTAYRDMVHRWAGKVRADYGLYKYIRSIQNPSFRLVEFHVTHLLGGALDANAGDGSKTPSAIPILEATPRLRTAIATLWRDSNWQIQKDIWTRQSAALGDGALLIVDDPLRRKVYTQYLHPGKIKEVQLDPWGNVKGYVLEYERLDPRRTRRDAEATATYTEVAERDGDNVVFRTLLNGQPYNWTDDPSAPPEWSEPYGFVPLVLNQHLNIGGEWGWSELQAGLPKFRDVDDMASALGDQVRRSVNPPWLMAGVEKSEMPTPPKEGEAGRQQAPMIWANNASATAKAMVPDVPIAEVAERIKDIVAEIERDYPELRMDIWTASGEASGRALRTARQGVSDKIQQRRAGYDLALVRAHQMAVAIGGFRGYDGYRGFSLDSFAAGKLDHQIGQRPVFAPDPLDDSEEETAFWQSATAAEEAGYPLELYLERKGWPSEDIDKIKEIKQQRAAQAAQAAQAAAPDPTAPNSAAKASQAAQDTPNAPKPTNTPADATAAN